MNHNSICYDHDFCIHLQHLLVHIINWSYFHLTDDFINLLWVKMKITINRYILYFPIFFMVYSNFSLTFTEYEIMYDIYWFYKSSSISISNMWQYLDIDTPLSKIMEWTIKYGCAHRKCERTDILLKLKENIKWGNCHGELEWKMEHPWYNICFTL